MVSDQRLQRKKSGWILCQAGSYPAFFFGKTPLGNQNRFTGCIFSDTGGPGTGGLPCGNKWGGADIGVPFM